MGNRNRPSRPAIIMPGKEKEMARELAANRCTKEYWEECAKSKYITSEAMEKMKEMGR